MTERASPGAIPDVVEVGRVLAELDDWRAITYVLMVLIFLGAIYTIWREILMNRERQHMRELASSFAESAAKVADALGNLSTQVAVLSALTARAETYIASASERRKP